MNAIIINPDIIARALKPPNNIIIKMIHTIIPNFIALYFMPGFRPAG